MPHSLCSNYGTTFPGHIHIVVFLLFSLFHAHKVRYIILLHRVRSRVNAVFELIWPQLQLRQIYFYFCYILYTNQFVAIMFHCFNQWLYFTANNRSLLSYVLIWDVLFKAPCTSHCYKIFAARLHHHALWSTQYQHQRK